jgi:diaminopimelate decarboxylase
MPPCGVLGRPDMPAYRTSLRPCLATLCCRQKRETITGRGTDAALELFPDSAKVVDSELTVGGVGAAALANEFGTPLVVYCEETIRARARDYRAKAPGALVVYGTKAFPNVALLRLLAEEGLGADVSTLGELRFAQQAGVPGERLVVHGNNKSDEELAAAVEARSAYVVLDSVEELDRARAAGAERMLIRITPGIEADTHESIRTGHVGSKFGVSPEEAATLAPHVEGLHIHVGSQLLALAAARETVEWLNRFLEENGWTPRVVDLGGGLGVPTQQGESAPSIAEFVDVLVGGLAVPAQVILEPGRSLVGQAGVTLYRVGSVKRSGNRTWVAVDGGISDNARPQLYGARYTAVVATRMDAAATGTYGVAGKHCESGDVLIETVALANPRRGDLLAIPATGAYTLAMASNYNVVPRPAAVLVADGDARVIRRRESLDDVLALET